MWAMVAKGALELIFCQIKWEMLFKIYFFHLMSRAALGTAVVKKDLRADGEVELEFHRVFRHINK